MVDGERPVTDTEEDTRMSAKGAEAAQRQPEATLPRDPDVVTREELAGLLNLTVQTIQNLTDHGVLECMDTRLDPSTTGGGAQRYSYTDSKQALYDNAKRLLHARLERKQHNTEVLLDKIVKALDHALDEASKAPDASPPTPELVADTFTLGAKAAKVRFAEAAQVIIKRDGLINRNTIADQRKQDLRIVQQMLRERAAPRPVLVVGKTEYFRAADIDTFIGSADLRESQQAEERRQQRQAEREQAASRLVGQMVELLDKALKDGGPDLPSPETLASALKIGVKAASQRRTEAVERIVERDDLLNRAAIAEEKGLKPAVVQELLRDLDAPEPVVVVGKTEYFRRADVEPFLQAKASQ
jgi:hypothetical protein